MEQPQISIIIPAYQHAETLPACLHSIFAQSIRDYEIIIIDDGSTDGTDRVLKPFLDRIQYFRQANQGGNAARNRGLGLAKGEYVIFCDADVVMEPKMLEKMRTALELHPEASYAYGGFLYGWKTFACFPFDPVRLKRMNFIHTTSLVRRADFPGFDPAIKRFQDWDVWLTMLSKGKIGVYIPEQLFRISVIKGRSGISDWLPSFMFRLPWHLIGWRPKRVAAYENAKKIIYTKHGLTSG